MDFSQKINFGDTVYSQDVNDELVLLDMKTENYFGLDSVARDIWKLLEAGKTLQEAYDTLLKMYEVEADQLHADIEAFIEKLIESGLAKLSD